MLLSFAPRNYHFHKKHTQDNRHNAYAFAWVVFICVCEYVVVLSERDNLLTLSFFIVKRDC